MMISEQVVVDRVVSYLVEGLKDAKGRVRVEELLSAAASITGERCIDAAAEFDSRKHSFAPGARVFSEAVNEILTGNVSSEMADVPSHSVFGIIRDTVVGRGYEISDFPSLEPVFAGFAARIGDEADWGTVPLSVPEENKPVLLPLRVAYETRPSMDKLLGAPERDATARLRIAALAVGESLVAAAQAIDRKVALLLALETVNGMAKTAPMTDDAFQDAAASEGFEMQQIVQKKPWWRFW